MAASFGNGQSGWDERPVRLDIRVQTKQGEARCELALQHTDWAVARVDVHLVHLVSLAYLVRRSFSAAIRYGGNAGLALA